MNHYFTVRRTNVRSFPDLMRWFPNLMRFPQPNARFIPNRKTLLMCGFPGYVLLVILGRMANCGA